MKFDIMKLTDIHRLLISYVIGLVLFQIVFFMENFLVVLRTVTSLFWILVLPGFGITYMWKLNFIERFALAVAISAALMGIFPYYLGLAGVHVSLSSLLLPALFIVMGLFVVSRDLIIKTVRK